MINAVDQSDVPIAVIGMACRLPGAENLQQLWDIVLHGRSVIGEYPADRFDRELFYDPRGGVAGKTYSSIGGVLANRTTALSGNPLAHEYLEQADTSSRLMYDVAATAVRNGGLDPDTLRGRNAGVYIGHNSGSGLRGDALFGLHVDKAAAVLNDVEEFRQLPISARQTAIDVMITTARHNMPRQTRLASHGIAETIRAVWGLRGPAFALDSACASSLQALLAASRALQLGRIDMAIVGGASDIKPDTLAEFAKANAASATGSRPFDAEADGVVCAEGYVAIVLKTVPQALADGDTIHAVIAGLGISSDGRGKGLWAPSPEGQVLAIERAYRGRVELSQLQYLEAHATSTPLGDGVELRAVNEALGRAKQAGERTPISSLKANLGHTLEAAGLAGLVKTILCMQHAVIPPANHVTVPNPAANWDQGAVSLSPTAQQWQSPADGGPRRAGVNAFGIGGLNMHVAVEEAQNSKLADRAVGFRPITPQPPERITDAIAVIGWGCVLPGALDMEAFSRRCELAGANGKVDQSWAEQHVTGFQYDWRRHKIPPKQLQRADPLQFYILDAVDQAMADAGFDQRDFDRQRTGVIVGSEFGGDFAAELQLGLRLPEMGRILSQSLKARGMATAQIENVCRQFSAAVLERWPALLDDSGSFHNSSLASRITRTWDLMGGAATVDGGGASTWSALSTALDLLQSGDCDLMICAAGQRRTGKLHGEPADSVTALEPVSKPGCACSQPLKNSVRDVRQRVLKPLVENASGVPDYDFARPRIEGAGVVLLKRLEDARRDGDSIHCVIRRVELVRQDAGTGNGAVIGGEDDASGGCVAGMIRLLHAGLAVSQGARSQRLTANYGDQSWQVDIGPADTSSAIPQVLHFDATQRRREKMRNGSASRRQV